MPANIYDALGESHERQRSLCSRMTHGQAEPATRVTAFQELRTELAAHAAAEERFLYAPTLMDDRGLDVARHALHEHHQIDELVEKIDSLKPDGKAWREAARQLAKTVRHHLKEEESRFFQVSGKILSDSQKQRFARQYRSDYERMKSELASG